MVRSWEKRNVLVIIVWGYGERIHEVNCTVARMTADVVTKERTV
jgi:hypothetical protein